MKDAKPIYVKLLIAAIVIYVVGISIMLSDLYVKVVNIEHILLETRAPHGDVHHH